jgi:hypothetical protein
MTDNQQDVIKLGREIVKLKKELAQKSTLVKHLELECLEAHARQKFLDDVNRTEIDWKTINTVAKSGESSAILCWSDWHVEERVESKTVNGLNEYSPTIASKRINNMIGNTCRVYEALKNLTKIDTIYIWLGGDIIAGYIHEELEENNYMSPTEACLFAQDEIVSAIEHIKKTLKPKQIIIVCNVGNHGRTTRKKRVSTSYKNSYEWMLYHTLARLYKPKNTHWKIATGYHEIVEVYGHTVRFHHGDSIRYQGGVGGVTIPANKKIAAWNKSMSVDLDIFGHYHQSIETRRWVCNGSLVGWNAYAIEVGAEYEPPSQNIVLISRTRGKIACLPVYCN